MSEKSSTAAPTPPSSISPATTLPNDQGTQKESSIPWPGSTYIIEHVATGRVITFKGGSVVLQRPMTTASMRWECVTQNGWMAFKDPASHMHLGYHGRQNHKLVCEFRKQSTWEDFTIGQRTDGDYILLMKWDSGSLKPVGLDKDGRLGVLSDVEFENQAVRWRFIGVDMKG